MTRGKGKKVSKPKRPRGATQRPGRSIVKRGTRGKNSMKGFRA